MKFHNEHDGIWACASLLHIPNDGLNNTLCNAFRALKKKGVLYASWKVGVHERNIEGRFFNNFTEERLRKYL